jgi:hypothetical protein
MKSFSNTKLNAAWGGLLMVVVGGGTGDVGVTGEGDYLCQTTQ